MRDLDLQQLRRRVHVVPQESFLFSDTLAANLRLTAPDESGRRAPKVVEGSKERIQVFQGAVIRREHGGVHETFTVRKVSYGVGVERIWPVHCPTIDRLEVVSRGDVRRAKLYYLRDRVGKRAKIRELRD